MPTLDRAPALACALALACAPTAFAAPYSSLTVFGDSLSDAGYALADDGSPIRYTNPVGPSFGEGEAFGPVAPMLLGAQLGLAAPALASVTAQGDNHAVGGLRTDQIQETIDTFLKGGRADPNALYYITSGGNDFIQFRVTSASDARKAADRLTQSVETLQQSGARTIMVWLLPDLGLTPAAYGGFLQTTVSGWAGAFNQQLLTGLSQVDAEVIPLNIPKLFAEVLQTPASFGLVPGDAAIATCFNGQRCTENPQYGANSPTPDPSKLLFNDAAHPTTTGHRLIADYAYSLLAAPWEVTLLPEMAQGSLRSHQDELRSQWQAPWQAPGSWQLLLAGSDQRLDHRAQSTSARADGSSQQLLLGTSYRLGEHWRLGLVNGFQHQRLTAGAADSRYSLDSYLLSAFGQYRGQHAWADLTLTGGLTRFDSQRRFALGKETRTEKGDTHGTSWALGGRWGFDLAKAGSAWQLAPFLSANYASTEVEGYREAGERATSLSFGEQQRDSRRLGLGLLGTLPLTQRLALYGEVSAEREYENQRQRLTLSQNALPAGLDFTLDGYQVPGSLRKAHLGLRYQWNEDWSIQGAYHWQQTGAAVQQGIGAGLNLMF